MANAHVAANEAATVVRKAGVFDLHSLLWRDGNDELGIDNLHELPLRSNVATEVVALDDGEGGTSWAVRVSSLQIVALFLNQTLNSGQP